jgi:hypothetical protein
MKRRPALLVLAVLAGGCAAIVSDAPREIDGAAKEFRPTPGKTTVYVFRDQTQWETGVGDTEKLRVKLDGALLGVTKARTFLVAAVEPGRHELVSIAGNESALEFVGQPGEVVYVYQEVSYLVSVSTRLHRVDAATAQPRIRQCDLVPGASMPPLPAPPPVQPPTAPRPPAAQPAAASGS